MSASVLTRPEHDVPARLGVGVPALELSDVSVRVGETWLLREVSLSVAAGELLAIVGPNGAGKSTLLGVAAGDRSVTSGRVAVAGTAIHSPAGAALTRLARRRAVLPQSHGVAFAFTVLDVVRMGRSPWRGTTGEDDDCDAVAQAMADTGTEALAEREIHTLSGGEQARAALGRVLAQRTQIALLDEPTAALDLRHQEHVMQLARGLADTGDCVVVVVHDLSLAAAYSDRLLLLDRGRVAAVGAPRDVLNPELLHRVYGLPLRVRTDPDTGELEVRPVRTGWRKQ